MSNISHASPDKERPANSPQNNRPPPGGLHQATALHPPVAPQTAIILLPSNPKAFVPPSQRPGGRHREPQPVGAPRCPDDLFRRRSLLSRHRGGCAACWKCGSRFRVSGGPRGKKLVREGLSAWPIASAPGVCGIWCGACGIQMAGFFSFSRLARRRPSLLGRRGVEELDVHMP
ncbi:hypothetical protein BKA56DRAFT_587766 [Ilyonectria sp. MPI-CAGE-AT-0026]|nr:hypothetical protein BKA56DRAFT_587766 [Ilyonectria sp. MPI-CAGE-AT-0026]